MAELDPQGNVNVTLGTLGKFLGDLIEREFPCPLCGAGLPILSSKSKKPYFVCNKCGVQVFVRGKAGISKLRQMADSGILISGKKESLMHGINLFNRLESLKLQKHDLEMKRGIVGIIFPDENLENAVSLVDAEIKKIEGELAKVAEETKDENTK
jgi:DNA-directed RNA polymerase subunit RPC12/RpoP